MQRVDLTVPTSTDSPTKSTTEGLSMTHRTKDIVLPTLGQKDRKRTTDHGDLVSKHQNKRLEYFYVLTENQLR